MSVRAFNSSGALWLQAPPDLRITQKTGIHFDIGWDNNLSTWLYRELHEKPTRVRGFLEQDPADAEMLSPEQVVREFPQIRSPQKSPMRRAEARYYAERDQKEMFLVSALQDRDAGTMDTILPLLLGGLGAGATDPFAWASAAVPGLLGLPLTNNARRAIMAAKMARTGMPGRLVMMGTTAADAAIGELAYIGAQAGMAPWMNRDYTMEQAAGQFFGAGTIGGMLGFTFPKKLGSVLGLSRDEQTGMAALSYFNNQIQNMDYKTFRNTLKNDAGLINVGAFGSFLNGRSTDIGLSPKIRSKVSVPVVWDKSNITRLQGFVDSKIKVPNVWGRRLRFQGPSVVQLAGHNFKPPKTIFNPSNWNSFKMNELRDITSVYMTPPKYVGRGFEVFSDPIQTALNAAKDPKKIDNNPAVFQARIPGHSFIQIDQPNTRALGQIQSAYYYAHQKEMPKKTWGEMNSVEKERVVYALKRDNRIPGYIIRHEDGTFDGWVNLSGFDNIRSFSNQAQMYEVENPRVTGEQVRDLKDILEGVSLKSEPPAIQMIEELYTPREVDENFNIFYHQMMGEVRLRDNVVSSGPYLEKTQVTFNGQPLNAFDLLARSPYEVVVREIVDKKRNENIKQGYRVALRSAKTLHDVIQTIGKFEKVEGLTAFRDELKDKGFVWGSGLHPDRTMRHYFLTDSAVIPPTKKNDNLRTLVYKGEITGTIPLSKADPLVLDISRHPRSFTMEEALVAKFFTREMKGVFVDPVLNSSSYVRSPAQKVLSPEVQTILGNLGYSGVKYRVGKQDITHSFEHRNASDTLELKKNWDRLKEQIGKKEKKPEGETAPVESEEVKYYDSLYDLGIKGTNGDYYSRLISEMRNMLPKVKQKHTQKGTRFVDPFQRYETRREELLESIKTLQSRGDDLAGTAVKEAYRDLSLLQSDIEKMHKTLYLVNQGYVFTGNSLSWLNQEAITSLFKTQIDMPYHTMGGVHVESIQKAFQQNLSSHLISRLKQAGGKSLLQQLHDGILDEDILKISYMRDALQGKKEANLSEELAKKGGVSENAMKVEAVFREVMTSSQELLTQAGFWRKRLPGYIGKRSYSGDIIRSTPLEEFIADGLKYGKNVDRKYLTQLYADFSRFPLKDYDDASLLTDIQNNAKPRVLYFKDATSEYKFRKKYGSAGHGLEATGLTLTTKRMAEVGKKALSFVGADKFFSRTDSELFRGVLDSINDDATNAAVVSIWGNYPFMSLELANRVLDKKVTDLLDKGEKQGGISFETFETISAGISRSKAVTRGLLEDWVFGTQVGHGKLARWTRVGRSLTKSSYLPLTASRWAFFGDMAQSVMMAQKVQTNQKRNLFTFLGGVANRLESMVKLRNIEDRRELGRIMNTAVQWDTQDFLSKFNTDTTGAATWIESAAMRVGGAPYLTDVGRASNLFLWGKWMDNVLKRPFAELADEAKHTMGTHGITSELWDTVRGLGDEIIDDFQGHKVFSLSRLEAALLDRYGTGQGRDIYNRFSTFILDNALTRSIIQNSKYSQNVLRPNRGDPEGLLTNVLDLALEFKSMGVEATWGIDHVRRFRRGKGVEAGTLKDQFLSADMANLMSIAFVWGAFHLWARDLSEGREMRVPEDFEGQRKFIYDAMLNSGFVGIMGDYLLSDQLSTRAGWFNLIAGPTISGLGFEVVEGTVKTLASPTDLENAQRQSLDVAERVLPSAGIWSRVLSNTLFLDSLGDLSEWFNTPEQIRRRIQRNEEAGTGYRSQ